MEIKITLSAKQMQIAFNALYKFFNTTTYLEIPEFDQFQEKFGGNIGYNNLPEFELHIPLHLAQSMMRDIINFIRYCPLEDFQRHFDYPEKAKDKTKFLLEEMCDLALHIEEQISKKQKITRTKEKARKMALKSFIKENAALLKGKKTQLSTIQRKFSSEGSILNYSELILIQAQIKLLQEQTRYLHIIYGEIRGKERTSIEKLKREIDEKEVKKLSRRFSQQTEY